MVSKQLLIFPILAAIAAAAPQGYPVSISAPSFAGKYGAALFGQRYNENTDADRVTLNLGFKKESGQSAGSNMANYGGGGGGGMGMGQPGPHPGGPGPHGPAGFPGPGGFPGGPVGNPYAAAAGGGYGYGGQQAGGHASQFNKLGLDVGITREKGQKHAQGQQQGVVVGFGRR
ncbi:unnamed protein product [Orchesella dallaii]|uniref:Uncharacterized protein n=1 Tax=Orchesella dallaii TaxID=48710 RepID=A0ABP1R8S2_9HEXA